MFNKENVLSSIKNEDRILISNVLDKVLLAERSKKASFTDFMDLYQQKSLDSVLRPLKVDFRFDGGYSEAERKMAVILPQDKFESYSLPIEVLNITFKGKMFNSITHRDILGAIMSLGIKREKIGDIILNDNGCQVIVHVDILNFLIYNLDKVRNTNIYIKIDDNKTISPVEQKFIQITGFVPSLRLDCIVEEGFGIPRSQALQLIKGEKVFVNWELISKSFYEVQQNDTISVRGMGRLVFEGTFGTTRKDRLVIKIKKII